MPRMNDSGSGGAASGFSKKLLELNEKTKTEQTKIHVSLKLNNWKSKVKLQQL